MTLEDTFMDDGRIIDMPERVERIDRYKHVVFLGEAYAKDFLENLNLYLIHVFGRSSEITQQGNEIFRRASIIHPGCDPRSLIPTPHDIELCYAILSSELKSNPEFNNHVANNFVTALIQMAYDRLGYDSFTLRCEWGNTSHLLNHLKGEPRRPLNISIHSKDGDNIGGYMNNVNISHEGTLYKDCYQYCSECVVNVEGSVYLDNFNFCVSTHIEVMKDVLDNNMLGQQNTSIVVYGDVNDNLGIMNDSCRAVIIGDSVKLPFLASHKCVAEIFGEVNDIHRYDMRLNRYYLHDKNTYDRLEKVKDTHVYYIDDDHICHPDPHNKKKTTPLSEVSEGPGGK